MCPLAFLAGFVDAIAGGGGLISLTAYIFAGLPVHLALGTNKLSNSMGPLVATARYALRGYMVREFVLVAVPLALAGSWAGSNAALVTEDTVFRVIMLAALPFVAFFVLRTRDLDAFSRVEIPRGRALATTACIALAMGFYDGFFGPGTGTFLMLLLTALAHQDVRHAQGTTKAVNISTNLAALAVFAANGQVLLGLGLVAGAFNIVGNWLGSQSFIGKGSAIARPVMLAVIAAFFVKLLVDIVAG